jgi:hypothetical protein
MDSAFRPPQELNFDSNTAENWRLFKQEIQLFIIATERERKSGTIKTSILLTTIGRKGREIYNNFVFAEEADKNNYEVVLQKFEDFCNPRTNETFLRYKFFTIKQSDTQSFDDFVTKLKKAARECNLGELRDSLTRDMIVIGVQDRKLQEKLLRENNLTLENAIIYGQTCEITRKHTEELQGQLTSSLAVNKVNKFSNYSSQNRSQSATPSESATTSQSTATSAHNYTPQRNS